MGDIDTRSEGQAQTPVKPRFEDQQGGKDDAVLTHQMSPEAQRRKGNGPEIPSEGQQDQ